LNGRSDETSIASLADAAQQRLVALVRDVQVALDVPAT
jgi:hypothetical protein